MEAFLHLCGCFFSYIMCLSFSLKKKNNNNNNTFKILLAAPGLSSVALSFTSCSISVHMMTLRSAKPRLKNWSLVVFLFFHLCFLAFSVSSVVLRVVDRARCVCLTRSVRFVSCFPRDAPLLTHPSIVSWICLDMSEKKNDRDKSD